MPRWHTRLVRVVGQVADGEDRDRGKDAEDRHDDEKLDEREALLEQVLSSCFLMCLNNVLLLVIVVCAARMPLSVSVRTRIRTALPLPVAFAVALRSDVVRGAFMPAASAPRMRTCNRGLARLSAVLTVIKASRPGLGNPPVKHVTLWAIDCVPGVKPPTSRRTRVAPESSYVTLTFPRADPVAEGSELVVVVRWSAAPGRMSRPGM